MTTAKINKRAVDAQKPASKDQYLWDSLTKGFALKTTPRGTKTYLFEYKDKSRKTRICDPETNLRLYHVV